MLEHDWGRRRLDACLGRSGFCLPTAGCGQMCGARGFRAWVLVHKTSLSCSWRLHLCNPAVELDLDETCLEGLRVAGLMHDIG